MAIQINDDLLQQLGLGSLPQDEKTKLLRQIYDTLEMRVGMKLAEQMSDAQLDEFEQFVNTNDEQGAFRWLETNFPNYKEVVASEFEALKSEIAGVAPQILAAAQQPQAQQQYQVPAQPSPSMPPQYPQPPQPPIPPTQQPPMPPQQ